MSTTIHATYEGAVDYIQTAAAMYYRGVEVCIDGFSWIATIPRATYTPTHGVTIAAVDDNTVVARGTVEDTVVTDGTTEVHVTPSMTGC